MGKSKVNHTDMDAVLEAMPPECLILTVNRRLSLNIRDQYNQRQIERGRLVWESANIISWYDWMQSLFQDLVDHGESDQTLLSPHQTRMLWEQVICRSERDLSLLRPTDTARMADEAWGLIQAWNIQPNQLSAYANYETELFLSWTKRFTYRCKQENWIDATLLPRLIAAKLRDGSLALPDQLILAGFDEITPQQQEVLDVIAGQECDISVLSPEQTVQSARRFQTLDTSREIHTAALWSIKRLQDNKEARVGIVVPELSQLRREIEKIFDRCLDPASILPEARTREQIYNISLGIPLAQCPLVVDASLILRLATGGLSCGDLSRLLRSTFISAGLEERERRARLDAFIRRSVGEREISLDVLMRKVREVNNREEDACPVLLGALEAFRNRLDQLPRQQSPRKWSEEFQTLLNIFGWCRRADMNSTEFQQRERFNQAIVSFQQLGQIQTSMGLQEAIGRLRSILMETPFQAKGAEAKIQVVGVLEAAGLEFDHLWVVGMSDDLWPPQTAPNPFIPISLQRRFGLPHASPQRELEYAMAITARLLTAAPEVIVSHAERDGDNTLRISPLVADLQAISMDELDLADVPDIQRVGFSTAELEELLDSHAPSLPAGTHLEGGSGLLSDQSACPFRAFANHRLKTRAIEEPTFGMDARIRGTIIHHILQQIWEKIQTHDRLIGLEDTELRQLVSTEVSTGITRIAPRRPNTFVPRFVEIEQQRVTDMLLQWLQLERSRAPFRVVSLEHKQTVTIGGLQLDVITDRIDELDDGRQLIIDYKTKKKKDLSCKGWFEQRIEESQLPLYATSNQKETAGAVLAGINSSDMGFKGICEQSDLVPGIKAFTDGKESNGYAGWDDLKTAWKQRLELLAQEILAGRAEVMPKNPGKECLYCPLPSLCRIHEWEDEA